MSGRRNVIELHQRLIGIAITLYGANFVVLSRYSQPTITMAEAVLMPPDPQPPPQAPYLQSPTSSSSGSTNGSKFEELMERQEHSLLAAKNNKTENCLIVLR